MMHSFGGYSMFGGVMPYLGWGALGIFIGIFLILVLILKGYALWLAARAGHKGWFIALLILNTAGILELIYILAIAKKRWPSKN